MKKSEYQQIRAKHWSGVGFLAPANIRLEVLRDVAAAEAAGVKWGLDEEPPPERIAVGGETRLFLYGLRGASSYSTGELSRRDYEEAVRRYNLVPKLTALAEKPAETGECARCKSDLAYLLLRGGE